MGRLGIFRTDLMRTADTNTESAYGWVVVAAAFTVNAVGFGILYSFTIFFKPILTEFGGGRGAVSIIPSVAAALMLATGAVVGRMADRYGPQRMVATGAVLFSVGLWLASLSTSIWHVYLSYGLLLGLGVGLAFLPSNAAVGQWFSSRRGLATGIAVAGSGVGSVILGPFSQGLISTYDWRIATRILALIGFVLLSAAAVAIRGRGERHTSSVLPQMRTNSTFRKLYASAFIASFGYWVPFVHIVPYARDHGITAKDAALLVSVMGLCNIGGRIILGLVADRLGRRRILQLAVIAMSAAVLLWPFASGRLALLAFAAAYGFFAGTFISLLFALTADYFGSERLAGISGLLNTAAALGTLMGAPLVGLLFDTTGSYAIAIMSAGAAMGLGSMVLMLLPPERSEPT